MHRFAKVALMALVAGAGLVTSVWAQETTTPPPVASQCAAVPPAPSGMPDGATATRAQIEAFNATYTEWVTAANAAARCRHDEAMAQRAAVQPMVTEFNDAQARVTAINAYWTALVNMLNTRSGAGNRPVDPEEPTADQQQAPELPDESTLGSGPVTPANSASRCAAIPQQPPQPNLERARTGAIRSAVDNYNTWLTAAQASLECRHAEVRASAAGPDALIAEYNAATQTLASTSQTWQAEVAEFNAR